QVESLAVDNYGDIAVGKILNYEPPAGQQYPTFTQLGDDEVPSGRSLCILGHAFHQFTTVWDDESDSFKIPPAALPIPRFPMECMLTRGIIAQIQDEDSSTVHERKFIELSSPGLRGQSGGPVFDVNAKIMGLQSQTISHEMGFNTKEKQWVKK
ncbi:MAG: trypsin-like peptidase domain-containing protein, partial [Nitrospinae bacterium]|nr:trypsin-like peptidase domain-containing protein [Nitrospinota bacterium]